MNTAKVYTTSDGEEVSIFRMVREEPQWAAKRVQEGEKAIKRVAELEAEVMRLTGLLKTLR